MTIKAKEVLIWSVALVLFVLGILNLRQTIVMETIYIIGFCVAGFLLFMAAMLLEISLKCKIIVIIKVMRFISRLIVGLAIISLIAVPVIAVKFDYQKFKEAVLLGSIGLNLLLIVIKEMMRDWKKPRPRVKRQFNDLTATYFEQLPKITQTRKKPIYFEFD